MPIFLRFKWNCTSFLLFPLRALAQSALLERKGLHETEREGKQKSLGGINGTYDRIWRLQNWKWVKRVQTGTWGRAILTTPIAPEGVCRGMSVCTYRVCVTGIFLSLQKGHAPGDPTNHTISTPAPTSLRRIFPTNIPSQLQHEIQESNLLHQDCLLLKGERWLLVLCYFT